MNKFKLLLLACFAAGIFQATDVAAASSSNTLVRFQLRYGIKTFGNVDVELFDYDKPATVSNFLAYVRSGAFNHTFMDYVKPGYFIKGGQYSVGNPYSDELFESVTSIPEGPAITNEFNTTRVIPNLKGTLAMSLNYEGEGTNSTTVRDSATTSWFFNLWDNSTDLEVDFDGQGFVVFGRVVKGMNYLNYFNNISTNDYVLDMNYDPFLFSDCAFPAEGTNELSFIGLPVPFNLDFGFALRCPQYNDLLNVSISILRATNVVDKLAPKLKLTHPIATTVITNDFITVRGTVTDTGSGVDSVLVYLNTNAPVLATLTSSNTFFADLTAIPAGTNYIKVEVNDENGNRSVTSGTFFFDVKLPLTLTTTTVNFGTGTFAGVTNGQMLSIGKIYSVTAVPDPTNIFVAWFTPEDDVNPISLQTTVQFLMKTNATLKARFDTNYFRFVKGTYNGLFVTDDEVDPGGSGFVTITVSELGSYSMKIIFNGTTAVISGRFKTTMDVVSGFLNITTSSFRGVTYIPLRFDSYFSGDFNEPRIDGFVTNRNIVLLNDVITTNHISTATLVADRKPIYTGTNISPYTGKYTMVLPSDGQPGSPAGDGYGLVTVSPQGLATIVGSLADGTKFTHRMPISTNGHLPLYLSPIKTNAALISWINFTNEPASDFSGLFNWFKYRHVTKYYTNGFTNAAVIVGSRFLPPDTTNHTLFLDTAVVGFTNGNLVADFANDVTIAPNGKVTNAGTNKLSLSLSGGNGLMTGSVTPPAGGKSIPFKGVVLQKQTNAAGYFLGTNASGRVQLSR